MIRLFERAWIDRALLDEAPVGLAFCDGEGRFVEVSHGAAVIWGRRAGELIGHHCTEVVHPDDRAVTNAVWWQLATGKASHRTHQLRCVRPGGEVRWVSATLTRLEEGRAGVGIVAQRLVDVTAQRLAEEERDRALAGLFRDASPGGCADRDASERLHRLRTMFDIAPFGLATLDDQSRMVDVNIALGRMLGDVRDRLVGQTLDMVIHPDDAERVADCSRRARREDGAGYDVEARLVRRDRGFVWARIWETWIDGPAGPACGFVMVEDITRRRQAEESWRELDAVRHAQVARLSLQERRILEHMAEGWTNRQIAETLSLAEKTVRNYVSNLLAKMGMHRRSEAAAFAARLDEGRDPLPRD